MNEWYKEDYSVLLEEKDIKRIRVVICSCIGLLLPTSVALACYTCFSTDKTDPNNIALGKSVLFLLSVIIFVLALLGKFFLSVRKREKLLNTKT